jgi:hypothetical protein
VASLHEGVLMDFSNERYVRLYVRDTTSWKLLKWEGQTVWTLLYRKADRSGVISLDGLEPWEAATLHCDLPEEVSKPGMERCLARGWVVRDGDRLVFPKYIEANETPMSDAQRARESRAKRASLSQTVTASSQNVTDCHAESHAVTPSHTASHGVTLNRAVPAVPEEELRTPPTRVASDLIQSATGVFFGTEWARELQLIGIKPDVERAAVLAAIRGDPWCKANKNAVDPRHVLKHWAKYAAGNPPLKSVVRAAVGGKYAGPSRVATAEEYADQGEDPW